MELPHIYLNAIGTPARFHPFKRAHVIDSLRHVRQENIVYSLGSNIWGIFCKRVNSHVPNDLSHNTTLIKLCCFVTFTDRSSVVFGTGWNLRSTNKPHRRRSTVEHNRHQWRMTNDDRQKMCLGNLSDVKTLIWLTRNAEEMREAVIHSLWNKYRQLCINWHNTLILLLPRTSHWQIKDLIQTSAEEHEHGSRENREQFQIVKYHEARKTLAIISTREENCFYVTTSMLFCL